MSGSAPPLIKKPLFRRLDPGESLPDPEALPGNPLTPTQLHDLVRFLYLITTVAPGHKAFMREIVEVAEHNGIDIHHIGVIINLLGDVDARHYPDYYAGTDL